MTSGTSTRFFTSRSSGNPRGRGTRGIDNGGSVDSEFETAATAPDDSSFGHEDKSARSGNVGSKQKSDAESGRSDRNRK